MTEDWRLAKHVSPKSVGGRVRTRMSRQTYRFASVRAILIVNLYPAKSRLKPSMSSPMYLNFAYSRKLVRLLPDRDSQSRITCWNSLQVLPHRSKGRSSAERSILVVALTMSMSGPRTSFKARSSSIRSRTRFGWE